MDFDERYFINSDGRLRTPIKLYGALSGHSKSILRDKNTHLAPVVPQKKINMSGNIKRLRGDNSESEPFRKLDFS